jgi:hypothetical protein
MRSKARPSFLKKRSKKLSSIAIGPESERENSALSETEKSFLLLFFKKEVLTSFQAHA